MVLEYNIQQATTGNEAQKPLILLLHGYGSDENDLFSFAPELPTDAIIVSAKAPHAMQPMGNAWYAIHWDMDGGKKSDLKQAAQSRDLIVQFIDELVEKYPIDITRVTLLGFSQGAILSYGIALTYPAMIKNVIALSGYVEEGLIHSENTSGDKTSGSLATKLATAPRLPQIYCSHGTVDQVIPVEAARNSAHFLRAYDLDFKYSEFPVGHGVHPNNFYELKEWLMECL